MDLKKEIKLSDLVRRPQKKTQGARRHDVRAARRASGRGSRRSSASRSAPPRSPPRASSTTAAGRSSCSSRASRSSPASSSPARCATSPRSRRRSTSFFRKQQASAARRAPRHRHEPDRRALVRAGGDRRRAPARERDPLPRARGALDPGRRGGARLPRRLRERQRGRAALAPRRPRRRVPGLDRPLRRGLQGRPESRSPPSTWRRSPCCAPSLLRPRATSRPPSSR